MAWSKPIIYSDLDTKLMAEVREMVKKNPAWRAQKWIRTAKEIEDRRRIGLNPTDSIEFESFWKNRRLLSKPTLPRKAESNHTHS